MEQIFKRFLILLIVIPLHLLSIESNISFQSHVIYWTAKQNNMEFLRLGQRDLEGELIFFDDDQTFQAEYDWAWGYGFGVSWEPVRCNPLLVSISYNTIETSGEKIFHLDNEGNNGLIEALPSLPPYNPVLEMLFLPVAQSVQVNFAQSKMLLSIDEADISMSFVQPCFLGSWSVQSGVYGLHACSNWHTIYRIFNLDILEGQEALYTVDLAWKYRGAGPLLGIGATAFLGNGFYINGKAQGILLYGTINTQSRSVLETIGEPIVEMGKLSNICRECEKLVPGVHVIAGIGFEKSFSCVTWQIELAGEAQSWMELAENVHYTLPQGNPFKDSHANLDLFGLHLRLSLGF